MRAWVDSYAGNRAVILAREGLTAVVLPDLGAKIISLVSSRTGREFVWRDPHRELLPIRPGSTYAENDASGIDDCFPTIDRCLYPGDPFRGLELGDHGDLWSRQWDWRRDAGGALFTVAGAALPYRFEKWITIESSPSRLVIENTLHATGENAFDYQWTGHPLFHAEEGMRIGLSHGCAANTGFATGGRLMVNGSPWSWPEAPAPDGSLLDVSVVGPPDEGLNEKYWLAAPGQGCALNYLAPDEQLCVGFDPSVLPWMAVCVNYGGWPASHPGYWVAVEPSTSPHDSLTDTCAAGLARRIGPGETHRWSWSLSVTAGGGGDLKCVRPAGARFS